MEGKERKEVRSSSKIETRGRASQTGRGGQDEKSNELELPLLADSCLVIDVKCFSRLTDKLWAANRDGSSRHDQEASRTGRASKLRSSSLEETEMGRWHGRSRGEEREEEEEDTKPKKRTGVVNKKRMRGGEEEKDE